MEVDVSLLWGERGEVKKKWRDKVIFFKNILIDL